MTTNNCVQCGGLIMEPGKVYGYAGPVCHCIWRQTNLPSTLLQGWICQLCGQSVSPYSSGCPNARISITNSTRIGALKNG